MTSDKVLIGKIINAHSIKGDIKVKSYTINPIDICSYTPLFNDKDQEIKLKLKSAGKNDVIIAHIDGINDRTAAETLKGTELYTLKSSIIDSEDDEILFSDLIGFNVLDKDNNTIGIISDLLNYGAGDVLEIKLNASEKTALISYNDYSILEQDNEQGFIKIDTEHLLES